MRFGRAGYRRIDLKRARKKPTFSAATSLPRTRVSMIAEVPFFLVQDTTDFSCQRANTSTIGLTKWVIAGRKRMPLASLSLAI